MSILERFKQSGDAHVGQTLTRLARLAEAAHQYEAAMRQSDNATCSEASDSAHEDVMRSADFSESMR